MPQAEAVAAAAAALGAADSPEQASRVAPAPLGSSQTDFGPDAALSESAAVVPEVLLVPVLPRQVGVGSVVTRR